MSVKQEGKELLQQHTVLSDQLVVIPESRELIFRTEMMLVNFHAITEEFIPRLPRHNLRIGPIEDVLFCWLSEQYL